VTEPHDPPEDAGETGPSEPKAAAASPYRTPTEPSPASGGKSGWRRIAIGSGGAVLVVVVAVASAPFWAPLLPWAPSPVPATESQPTTETPRSEPPPQSQPPGNLPEEAAAGATLQLLDRRLGALEGRPAVPASDIADLRQQLARLSTAVADLDARVAAIGQATPASAAPDTTDTALVLALLQIRGALEAGRPFAAEYEALAALARGRPEIAAAAAPLAEPAKTGVASRTVLANRLHELEGVMATPGARTDAPGDANPNTGPNTGEDVNATPSDWVDQALARLRGLVTIRRVDGAVGRPPGDGSKPPPNAAELALAGGDLEGAVGALDKLSGASAEAVQPWLRMAKQRLAVEAALHRIEALSVARLGSMPSPSPGAGSPR
jgi:hypothetical protein